jgi:uncharacterized membrane protein
METIEKSIEVDAPVTAVYNQWTQFEEFPQFMTDVNEVRQLDDRHLHWVASIGGRTREWDAEIIEQVPDDRIAWRSTSGQPNSGVVHFRPIDRDHTTVVLRMNYEPQGAMESIGSALGFVSLRVETDLRRFKEFVQNHRSATGAWRGEIHESEIKKRGGRQ